MVQKAYYRQNNGHLPKDPPGYLGNLARACWRKIVPYLESTDRVQYCMQYEINRLAYADIQENGIQAKLFSSLQDSSGKIIGKDFVGYRKNPAVGTMNDSNKQLNAIGIQLGLTPKGRQELMEIASQKKEKSMTEQMKEMGLA